MLFWTSSIQRADRCAGSRCGSFVLPSHRLVPNRATKAAEPTPTIRSRISEESRRDCAGAAGAHAARTQESSSIQRNFQRRGAGGRERKSSSRGGPKQQRIPVRARNPHADAAPHLRPNARPIPDPWCSRPGGSFSGTGSRASVQVPGPASLNHPEFASLKSAACG